MNIRTISIFALSLAMCLSLSFGVDDPATDKQVAREGAPTETEEARDARMQWWRDGKFGMFIHYGLYSGLAGELQGKKYNGCVEWIQQMSGMDSDTYANEALPKFSYKSGNAEEWVKLAKKAGCAYTVLTSRHHEGFNMFETKFIEFNAKKAIDIDVIKEFSSACKKHEMKAGYYFSVIDWSHPDYDPTGSSLPYPAGNHAAQKAGKRHFGNHDKYKEYLYNIFDELITNYDPIDIIWWDFSNPKFDGDRAWNATRLMKHLFDKHPMAIQNNRLYGHVHGETKPTPTWQGDFSTPEQFVPATGIGGDWETCQTTNGSWGYSATNHDWKSSVTLIHELIDTVSRGGNYLLNIGPEPDGSVPAAAIKLFTEMGAWMEKNGESIYGTRANPLEVELPWGRLTRKGDDITYIFVYANAGTNELILPCNFADDAQATLLDGGKQIKMTQDKKLKTTSIFIDGVTLDPAATVIKVTGRRIVISAKGFAELTQALTSPDFTQ